MIKKLLNLSVLAVIALSSCKKEALVDIPEIAPAKVVSEIAVPAGFTWQNSRTVNFTINITDARFQGVIHAVAIYDGNPVSGGKLMMKGSVTTITAFRGKIYLSSQISEVFVVSVAPDNTKVTQQVAVKSADISLSIAN